MILRFYHYLRGTLLFAFWQNLDESTAQRTLTDGALDEHIQGPYKVHFPVSPVRNEEGSSSLHPRGTVVIHRNPFHKHEDPVLPSSVEIQHYSESSKVIGTMKVTPGGLAGVDNTGISQLFPSSRPFSPSRCFMFTIWS